MGASFLHGVEVTESTTGPQPVTVVKSAVIGLIGTAPSWSITNPAPMQTPTLVSSAVDAAQFGPLIQGYTIPYALAAIQAQGAGRQSSSMSSIPRYTPAPLRRHLLPSAPPRAAPERSPSAIWACRRSS